MQQMSAGIQWYFELLDQARRRRGIAMEHLGYVPNETESEVALNTQGLRLRRFSGNHTSRDIALIVPAPIKQAYIWDLAPERSVVRDALNNGLQVYLIEWTEPGKAEAGFGLEHYGYRLLDACVDTIERENSPHKDTCISLLSHSLGGVLAAIYAAMRPERVASLVLVEAPLKFTGDTGAFGPLLAAGPRAHTITAEFDRVPGTVLNLASVLAAPSTFGAERYADLLACMGSSEDLRTHFLVERWTLDEAPMSTALFQDVIDRLYHGDAFMRGTLEIDGHRLAPPAVACPIYAVYDPRSRIIPPLSVTGFVEATSSSDRRFYAYQGDTGVALAHVGALVGESAHRKLWPEILAWLPKAHGNTH
ncbi:alpha/beta fold hydrolase [Herbaspirillum sp. GCM10030257]|uniref:alpha/beta fold hydrolase n=1 Tax=Herbaspirillum sp. GCM10030257 TaxID=3273393 RepID=UPI00362182E3